MKYFLSLIIVFSILVNPINTFAEEVVLAGGCFWCLEHDLESLRGINSVKSGYSGGDLKKELGQEGVVKRAAEEIINSLI